MKLPKNLSIYWVASLALAAWLFFVHAPPLLIKIGLIHRPLLMLHLLGVFSIYGGCLFNTLFTPSSLNGRARAYHVLVGRIAMVGGVFGALSGAWLTWVPFGNTSMSFAIPITVGGVAQLITQVIGYIYIKKFQRLKAEIAAFQEQNATKEVPEDLQREKDNALRVHIMCMVLLLTAACGNPASIRLAALFRTHQLIINLSFLVLLWVMAVPFCRVYLSRMVKRENQPGDIATEKTSLVA